MSSPGVLVWLTANALSLGRLVLGLVFPFLPPWTRLAAIVAAAASDALDGALSRAMGVTSTLGQMLDPLADKVFVLAVLGTLLVEGELAPGELILVAARDLCVAAGTLHLVATRGPRAVRALPPNLLGKAATALQFAFLAERAGVPLPWPRALFVLTAGASAAAGVAYLTRDWASSRRRSEEAPTGGAPPA
jgi:phosphatidylglycerophosphate synthase